MIAVDKLHSIGVVVNDLDAAMTTYGELLGIDHWDVAELGPDRLDVVAHGRRSSGSFLSARGATTPPADDRGRADGRVNNGELDIPVCFELVQPLDGESPFAEFRFTNGVGVSHLTLAVSSPQEFAETRAVLARSGLEVAASITVDGVVERHFIDTRAALGGFLVEIVVPLDGGLPSTYGRPVDVSGRYERAPGVGPLAVRSVAHIGVVVDDMMARLRDYHRVLGVPSFNVRDWRTEPGRLESPHFHGEPVQHSYFTGLTPFRDFGFEIIQPTFGPSHYNRDFRDVRGQGIHHLLLQVTSSEVEWDAVGAWLAERGAPRVMGSELMRGAMCFCYYDTAGSLGYIVEGVLSRRVPDEDLPRRDYLVDFAALASASG